jgi:cytochrome c553
MNKQSTPQALSTVTAVVLVTALSLGFSARNLPAVEITADGVYAFCVSCHGKQGAGGEGGRYPRIAGLPQAYLDAQIHAFRSQERVNKPMIPIFKHVRFDEEVIDLVSAHVAAMAVPDLGLWPYQPDPDALATFASRADYVAAGAAAYDAQCASCHGASAEGMEATGAPPLVAQYPAYLRKQIGDFAADRRHHEQSDQCGAPDDATTDAILNHLIELGRL